MRSLRQRTIALSLMAGLLGATPVWAQDRASISTAREVAKEGLEAFDAGDYETAAQKLDQAYGVVQVPTLALYTARAYEKVGRWVEAAEIYLEATRLDAKGSDAAAQERAKKEAVAAREALLPRIPRLVVEIEGAGPEEVAVTIDGALLPTPLLAAGRLLDPGEHRISGKRGNEVVEKSITVEEGASATVALRFGGASSAADSTNASTSAHPADDAASNGQRVAGWLAIGVGGASLVVGTISGISVLGMKGNLEDGDCLDRRCGPDEHDAVDRYNQMRTISTVGFVVGGVGIAAGTALLITGTRPRGAQRGVAPVLGWRSVGVQGRF